MIPIAIGTPIVSPGPRTCTLRYFAIALFIELIGLKAFCTFCLDTKSTKKVKPGLPPQAGPAGRASAHEESINFRLFLYYRSDRSSMSLRE